MSTRQIVSVVNDSGIGLYLADADGSPVRQLAQMVNPGLDVSDVVQLGLTLGDALAPPAIDVRSSQPRKPKAVNGHKPKALPAASKSRDGVRSYTRRGLSQTTVLDALRQHPGSTIPELCLIVSGSDDHKSKQALAAHFKALRNKGYDIAPDPKADQSGSLTRWRVYEPKSADTSSSTTPETSSTPDVETTPTLDLDESA